MRDTALQRHSAGCYPDAASRQATAQAARAGLNESVKYGSSLPRAAHPIAPLAFVDRDLYGLPFVSDKEKPF